MEKMIFFIMGVSGSGKSTIGQLLSERTGIPFFDADDYHSDSNKKKMQEGHPLTDEDRQGWLLRLNQLAAEQSINKGVIIACSALKARYRDILSNDITIPVHWVLLQGSYELIKERIEKRKGHYMPANLLQSQFDILETPANAIIEDIAHEPADIVEDILHHV
ncbi:MAG TPA: gluconokinase [Chitinophagaceae bacterium]|nr:gluconokinase [Chitinophagaceae bacterium]